MYVYKKLMSNFPEGRLWLAIPLAMMRIIILHFLQRLVVHTHSRVETLPPHPTLELCRDPTRKFWLLLQKLEEPGRSFIHSQSP